MRRQRPGVSAPQSVIPGRRSPFRTRSTSSGATTCLWGLTALLLLAVAACAPDAQPLPPAPAPTPTVTPPVTFPRDAGAHDVLTEWWYYTGHLATPGGLNEYGFEFTVFQVRRQEQPTGYLAHFAVTDVTGRTFSHQARFEIGDFEPGFAFEVDGWRLYREGGTEMIEAAMRPGPGAEPPFALRLRLVDRKPPALHEDGYIEYGEAGGSYYYSRTRIAATGEIRAGDGPWVPVVGQAWMDHQWGNFVIPSEGGWDWYSLQLDDNTEYMFYVLRGSDGQASAVYGSQVLPDGSVIDLEPGSVRIEAVDYWTSPHTGAVYPSGWRIDIPRHEVRLAVTPKLRDQELYFPGADAGSPDYWEGAVDVHGTRAGVPLTGVGYVELTGYAPTGAPS